MHAFSLWPPRLSPPTLPFCPFWAVPEPGELLSVRRPLVPSLSAMPGLRFMPCLGLLTQWLPLLPVTKRWF